MQEITYGAAAPLRVNLDPSAVRAFEACALAIEDRAELVWAEHCTECAMPACYASCSLYTPRPDLKCRRLSDGLKQVVVPGASGRVALTAVAFRQWGKLEARGRAGLLNPRNAALIRRADRIVARAVNLPMAPYDLTRRAAFRWNKVKDALADRLSRTIAPDAFLLEAYNQGQERQDLILTLKPAKRGALYQHKIGLQPGYNRISVPSSSWAGQLDVFDEMLVQLEPMGPVTGTLLLGIADFVRFGAEAPAASPSALAEPSQARPKAKCVVWDLDNTLWSGTLVEDGPDAVQLNPLAAAAIVALDQRGILNSIASKNSREDAQAVLKRFGLSDYFLFPAISWSPKSAGIGEIARKLNINEDTFLFIDDQAFERAEVEYARPTVETFDVARLSELLEHPRLNVKPTADAKRRRLMYLEESARSEALEVQAGGDVSEFLRSCGMRLTIADLSADNIDRAFELTERTNQLNYAGERLSLSDLEGLAADGCRRGLILAAADRFGDYGIIGFACLSVEDWEVENFFMSCRVQRKKVDHAFFDHLRRIARDHGADMLRIRYRPTKRNAPSRDALEEDMQLAAVEDGERLIYRAPTSSPIIDGDIVAIEDLSTLGRAPAARSEALA